MRALALLLLCLPLAAEHVLYVAGSISKGFVVGRRLDPSGIYIRDSRGFHHAGFTHPYMMTLVADPRDPNTLYAAAGNGIIRMDAQAQHWRILTDWRHTEYQDVAIDPNDPASLYASSTDGIIASHDSGSTWREASTGLHRRFISTLAVDRTRRGVLLAGGEDGIYLSDNAAHSWNPITSGARMVTDLAQSPHEASLWSATTQGHGIFLSLNYGRSWTQLAAIPITGYTWNNLDFSPHNPRLLATCAFGKGVWVSEDGGVKWQDRSTGLPTRQVWRVRFDPDSPGRLYASVHEEAIFVSPDAGLTWQRVGLDGSLASDIVFLPKAGAQ